MALYKDAEDWTFGRIGIFFAGFPSSLTGQCVSLVKFFLEEMTNVPNPQLARGNAKDYGNNLVAQGHAKTVSEKDRRRGDIVVWREDGGGYGHIAVLLSNDTVFEQNVGLPGTKSTQVLQEDGSYVTVYASRVDPLYANWRKGKPLFYRINTYTEGVVMDESDINWAYLAAVGRPAESKQVIEGNLGKKPDKVLERLVNSEEGLTRNHIVKVAYPKAVSDLEKAEADIIKLQKQLAEQKPAPKGEAEEKLQTIKSALQVIVDALDIKEK